MRSFCFASIIQDNLQRYFPTNTIPLQKQQQVPLGQRTEGGKVNFKIKKSYEESGNLEEY